MVVDSSVVDSGTSVVELESSKIVEDSSPPMVAVELFSHSVVISAVGPLDTVVVSVNGKQLAVSAVDLTRNDMKVFLILFA